MALRALHILHYPATQTAMNARPPLMQGDETN